MSLRKSSGSSGSSAYARTGLVVADIVDRSGTLREQHQEAETGRPVDESTLFDPGILETLVESAPDGAMIVNLDQEIIAFNRKFLEIWELDDGTVRSTNAGTKALRMIEDPEGYVAATEPFYGDRNLAGNGVVRLIDGRVLDWYTAAAYRSDGEFLGRVWYYRDATDRFLIAEELQRSGELYRQLAMHFPNGAVFLYE